MFGKTRLKYLEENIEYLSKRIGQLQDANDCLNFKLNNPPKWKKGQKTPHGKYKKSAYKIKCGTEVNGFSLYDIRFVVATHYFEEGSVLIEENRI
jgi:hypothetical protein